MQTIVLIPARMASTRLPEKPLAMVGGAPMIVQVWRRAMEAKLGEVVVACDEKAIASAIEREGGRAVITDPNLPSGSDRIYAALSQIDPQKKYDVVVNLQGDLPTINPVLLRTAAKLLNDQAVDIGTLAAPITNERDKNDEAVVKVIITSPERREVDERSETGGGAFFRDSKNPLPASRLRRSEAASASPRRVGHPPPFRGRGTAISFSRTAQGNPPYYHHIGIYAYQRAALEKFVSLPPSPLERKEKLEQLRAMEAGMRIDVAIVDEAPIGVDTPETLEMARKHYEQPN